MLPVDSMVACSRWLVISYEDSPIDLGHYSGAILLPNCPDQCYL